MRRKDHVQTKGAISTITKIARAVDKKEGRESKDGRIYDGEGSSATRRGMKTGEEKERKLNWLQKIKHHSGEAIGLRGEEGSSQRTPQCTEREGGSRLPRT